MHTAAEKLAYVDGTMKTLNGSALPPDQAFKRMTQLFAMLLDSTIALEKENDSLRREISLLWHRVTDLEDANVSPDSRT